ncbi:MAG: efflux RND transporter periplasmic adaptor subunit [Gemmataceae bacterium]
MKVSPTLTMLLTLISLSLPACHLMPKEQPHREEHSKIVATSPQAKDVIITQPYVCQIHSRRHINVRALQDGYLDKILVQEGQKVKKDEVMFQILPILYKAKYDAELAEVELTRIKLENTKKLYKDKIVSIQDVKLHEAELAKAKAKMELAKAELNFTDIKAPFDGIVDRLHEQVGSLIKERDILTTLSDNSVMWVYFNVPEKRYLEYMAGLGQDKVLSRNNMNAYVTILLQSQPLAAAACSSYFLALAKDDPRIELVLANGRKFPQIGEIGAIEAKFNNETGNIPFRADFPNPDRLLRHGQTGTVLIHRTLKNAIVIPQRATFETLDKRYVYVVGNDDVVHQREIVIQNELEDIFVIKSGLGVDDRIVLEGVRQVHDDEKVEYEFRYPEEVMANQKNHAE